VERRKGALKIKRDKTDYTIQSVLHALDIIEAFKGAKDDLGVTELSKELKLHKNNIFRLLATLETRGYIEQDKNSGNYRLGIKTFEMGQVFIAHTSLLKQSRPVMDGLRDKCNETVYVALLREDKAVYIDIAETTQSVRVANRVGELLPVHCTAVGKAQLSVMGHDEVKRIVTKQKLAKFTDHTILTRDALIEHLVEVNRKGYALDLEELEQDVFCIGSPVLDYTGRPVAGICISGPGCRMSRRRMDTELAPLVKAAALAISRGLGYSSEKTLAG
jgi:DNA-binding IclR family transcriptional regulator